MALTEEQRAKLNAKSAMKAAQRAEAEVVNDYNEPYELLMQIVLSAHSVGIDL